VSGAPRDEGRTAVYEAEDAAFGGTSLDERRSFPDLVLVADELTTGAWWQSARGPRVRVVTARQGAASSSARTGRSGDGSVEVRLAAAQQNLAALAHELAHALAGVGHGHDATFRAALVDVCALVADREASAALERAYRALDVPAGRRRWPPPVRATGAGFVVLPR
jgi:hypothetical protein